MGGCCSSRRRAELNESPVYYYRQRNFEKRNSLPTTRGATFASSAALLVDANLETSIPDTYRPQPAPLPYDADLRPQHQAMIGRLENAMDKDAQSARETLSGCSLESLLASEDLKESDPKSKTACPPGTPKTLELEPSKENESIIPATNDEDVCPTCLEGTHLPCAEGFLFFSTTSKIMMKRTQEFSQNVNIIFIWLAFLNGGREVIPAPYVIGKW
ncbi:probable E3 ubiquitin-protein ligase RHB1A isoform X1 [Aristolochia californica]|uniref:probable E3 ubiquitin-protein ligase RHB1A isoform X1 n=1 Tax=Aristolochia californica TaxID=171875 RepID=UPI0035E3AA82